MRIGIEAQRIFREKKHGMDFVVLEQIRFLQKMDLSNQYFIFVNEGPDNKVIEETQNFNIYVFGGAYPLWEQFYLPKKAKELGLDILHCTSNTAPINCPVPLIVTIHDLIYLETNPLKSKGYSSYQKFGNLYRRIVVKQICKSADLIITVSHSEKERFKEMGLASDNKVKVIYNGVSPHFKPIDDSKKLSDMHKKYNLPAKFFMFLGNTDPKKNTPNTIRAYARYCKAFGTEHKLVIGDLDPQVIKQYLIKDGLEEYFEHIHFTGYIVNTELPALINLADIFLYTSLRESFGIPLLEAMACGTPVITGDRSSLPEVAGNAAIKLDVSDPDKIVEAMRTLLLDDKLRQNLKELGLKRSADFSWEHTANGVLNLYQTYGAH
jgi:glycosyltransferase involved in cell wall biosynthesis